MQVSVGVGMACAKSHRWVGGGKSSVLQSRHPLVWGEGRAKSHKATGGLVVGGPYDTVTYIQIVPQLKEIPSVTHTYTLDSPQYAQ